MKTVYYHIIFLFSMCLPELTAQSITSNVLNSAGNVLDRKNISIEFNIGECLTLDFNKTPYMLTQGFLQPNGKINTFVKKLTDLKTIQLFPNPCSEWLKVEWHGTVSNWSTIEIFQYNGISLEKFIVSENNMIINTRHLCKGVYVLKITDSVGQIYYTNFTVQ